MSKNTNSVKEEKMKKLLAICLLSVLTICGEVLSQEKAKDRRKWIDETTIVSSDPRRVPIPATPQGPDGTLVS